MNFTLPYPPKHLCTPQRMDDLIGISNPSTVKTNKKVFLAQREEYILNATISLLGMF